MHIANGSEYFVYKFILKKLEEIANANTASKLPAHTLGRLEVREVC